MLRYKNYNKCIVYYKYWSIHVMRALQEEESEDMRLSRNN